MSRAGDLHLGLMDDIHGAISATTQECYDDNDGFAMCDHVARWLLKRGWTRPDPGTRIHIDDEADFD